MRSILHALGRMMVAFYMPERGPGSRREPGGGDDAGAALPVLGLSLEEVGRAAAAHWGLPPTCSAGMRSRRTGERGRRLRPR